MTWHNDVHICISWQESFYCQTSQWTIMQRNISKDTHLLTGVIFHCANKDPDSPSTLQSWPPSWCPLSCFFPESDCVCICCTLGSLETFLSHPKSFRIDLEMMKNWPLCVFFSYKSSELFNKKPAINHSKLNPNWAVLWEFLSTKVFEHARDDSTNQKQGSCVWSNCKIHTIFVMALMLHGEPMHNHNALCLWNSWEIRSVSFQRTTQQNEEPQVLHKSAMHKKSLCCIHQ